MTGSGFPPPDLDRDVDLGLLADVRAELAAAADRYTGDGDQIDALLLIATELATNAVRHGGGRCRLMFWHRGSTLYCRVADGGSGLRDPDAGRVLVDPTATGGRGLWLCRQLARAVHIHAGPSGRGTAITAVISSRAGSAGRPHHGGLATTAVPLSERVHTALDTSHCLCRRAAAALTTAAELIQRRPPQRARPGTGRLALRYGTG